MFYLETEEEARAKVFDEELAKNKSAKKRNEIRRKLRSSFESIDVAIFSNPGQNLRDLDCNAPSNEFQKRVELLKNKILCQMSQPRNFGKTVVNSQSLDSLVRKFVQNLENGEIVHVKSAVSQYQRKEIEKAEQKFEKCLTEAYKEIDLPVTDGLEGQLTRKNDELLEKFIDKTASIDLEVEYRKTVLERLNHFARKGMDDKMRENQLAIKSTKAEQQLNLIKSVEEFKSAVESEIKNNKMGSTEMQQHFDEQMEALVDSFKANTAQLDWIQEQVQDKLKEVKNWAEEKFKEHVKQRKEQERGA